MATGNTLQFRTPNDWALLRDKARYVTLRKDEPLLVEGVMGKSIYILKSGTARVERKTAAGTAKVAVLGAGDLCGEMAFVEKGRYSASVVADGELTAEVFDTTALAALFEAFPHVGARFFRSVCLILSQRLRNTSAALAAARSQTPS